MNVDMPVIVAAAEGVLAPKALIEDDVGIRPYLRKSVTAPFALGSGCHERSSRILTSNEFEPVVDGRGFRSPCHEQQRWPDRSVNAGVG